MRNDNARAHSVVEEWARAVSVNRPHPTATRLRVDGCRPGRAEIESETEVSDLVSKLTAAAVAAIANDRPALEHPVGHVRGVTVELVLTSARQVHEAHVFVERRTQGVALLAWRVGKEPAA